MYSNLVNLKKTVSLDMAKYAKRISRKGAVVWLLSQFYWMTILCSDSANMPIDDFIKTPTCSPV